MSHLNHNAWSHREGRRMICWSSAEQFSILKSGRRDAFYSQAGLVLLLFYIVSLLPMTFMTCKIFHNWSSDAAQDTRNSGIASPTDSLLPLPWNVRKSSLQFILRPTTLSASKQRERVIRWTIFNGRREARGHVCMTFEQKVEGGHRARKNGLQNIINTTQAGLGRLV